MSHAAEVIQLDGCTVPCDGGSPAPPATPGPDALASSRMANVFQVLADPGRVRMIVALLESEELCVCDLAALTGLSQTACSHNLRLLRGKQIVRSRREGRRIYYSLDDDHVRTLLAVARDHVAHVR